MATMLCLRRVPGVSLTGVGTAGGAAHNLAQVLFAMLILRTPSRISHLAPLLPGRGPWASSRG